MLYTQLVYICSPADGGILYYTLNIVHKFTKTGQPKFLAKMLKWRDEGEIELRGWRGRTVEVPDFSMEASRAGFVYREGWGDSTTLCTEV